MRYYNVGACSLIPVEQNQPWPGLARDMDPKPDHGERSQRGSGRLAGRKAVPIAGDLREEAFCRKLVADAVQGLGGLDIVVSNAGRQQSRSSILDLATEEFAATTKAATMTYVKSLAKQPGPKGIRVNRVSPGPIRRRDCARASGGVESKRDGGCVCQADLQPYK